MIPQRRFQTVRMSRPGLRPKNGSRNQACSRPQRLAGNGIDETGWRTEFLRAASGGVLLLCAWFQATVTLAQAPAAPTSNGLKPLLTLPEYCEGIVFDHAGNGYVSHGRWITKFTLDGRHEMWAETGSPNGHKILADGTHVVCDLSQRAVLHLQADGKPLPPVASACNGQPLKGPNDLSLDVVNEGLYFTDPEGSNSDNPIGTIHYLDRAGTTHQLDHGLAYPNGIVLCPAGKRLYVSESGRNRVLAYDVNGPGRIGGRRVFAELPARDPAKGQIKNLPDGMCLDVAGNLYVAHYGMQLVEVLDPKGRLIRQLDGGNLMTSNVAFGGTDMDQLFVTGALQSGAGAVFRLEPGVKGIVVLPPRR